MMEAKKSPTPPRSKVTTCEDDPACKTVQCAECLREIAAERAVKAETEDYVRHFCGLDCLHEWELMRRG